MIIDAVKCQECGDTIFSRALHDFHSCSCGKTRIDGGFDYTRVLWSTESPPESADLDLELTKKELYDDWNLSKNIYGIIKKGVDNV